MTNDDTPLSSRIYAALGGMRDAMTPEDVKAVQRFAKWIGEAEGAHAEIRRAEARQRFLASVDTRRMAETAQTGSVHSTGSAVAKPDAQDPC